MDAQNKKQKTLKLMIVLFFLVVIGAAAGRERTRSRSGTRSRTRSGSRKSPVIKVDLTKWKFPEPRMDNRQKHSGYNPLKIVKRQTIEQERKKAYVIVTTSAIKAASRQLPRFVRHKKTRGFNVRVVTERDFGGGGGDRAAKNIRGWLQKHYLEDNIQYVLLIGDAHPVSGKIPMKMVWTSSWSKGVPSDYYYADLTGNWDWNGDGQCGMKPEDCGPGGVDIFYEVLVGRIPVYASIKDLDTILRKTIQYELQKTDKIQWRKKALFVMPDKKSGDYTKEIIKRFLMPAGWNYHIIHDHEWGINPSVETKPCTIEKVTNVWKHDKFGLVLWWTHGEADSAYDVMDTLHVPYLNDNYPVFVVGLGCGNAIVERNDNLAYSLLKHGAICTLAATRGAGKMSWMGRDFVSRLVEGMSAGEALYETKLWQHGVGWNSLNVFNLYGDPSVSIFPSEPRSRRRFVNCRAAPGGDGLSWKTAYRDLQDVLDKIVRPGMVNEIWVAAGTYKPDKGTGRRQTTFRLDKGIRIYGGFTGNEMQLDQRDPIKNVTTLSGDIGIEGDSSDNSYHVIMLKDTWEAALIDGFTITGGNANGDEKADKNGGGIYNYLSNPTLVNCVFKQNSAADSGGAVYSCCFWNLLTLTNCLITDNKANDGGGLYLNCRARMTTCTLTANSAQRGGGIYNDKKGRAILAGCTLRANNAKDKGGEIYSNENNTFMTGYCNIEGGLKGPKCGGASLIDGGGNIIIEP